MPTDKLKQVLDPGQAQLEPHEIEFQRRVELLQQVRQVRAEIAAHQGGSMENADPSKVYVWVNIHPQRQIVFKTLRYRPVVSTITITPVYGPSTKDAAGKEVRGPVVAKNREVTGVNSEWLCENGEHHRGDTILFEVDKGWYQALKADEQLRALEFSEGVEQEFTAFAERIGVPVYKPPTK